MAESDDSGNTLTEYVWLDDMPIALIANVATSPTLYFVHTDHLNRPIMMTDANKAIVWQADYNPFGGVNSITGSATNNLRFPGQYFLIEDGLHYNWYRHYDPTIGRYIQPDPLGFVDGPNIYTYVNSRPTMQSDAKGRQATAIPGSPGFTPVPGVYIPGTPQNQDWVHHAVRGFKGLLNFCRRMIGSGSGSGGGDGKDQCHERYEEEAQRCRDAAWQVAHPDYTRACLERAADRRSLCIKNGGKPDANEPPEWRPGPDHDEETGINPWR